MLRVILRLSEQPVLLQPSIYWLDCRQGELGIDVLQVFHQ